MALYWINPATNNKFANKHLLVIGGSPSLLQLETAGIEVFEKRLRSRRLNNNRRTRGSAEAQQLKAEVGQTAISENTLIVMSNGSFQTLNAQVLRAGCKSQRYKIQNGVIFHVTATGYDVGLVASVHLGVRTCTGGHEVWHLEGTQITPMKSMTEAAKQQTTLVDVSPRVTGIKFTPTVDELVAMRNSLKPTAAPVSGQPPIWALSEIAKVDLSFLDD